MARPSDRARYSLPDVVSPDDSVCFQVPVPNDKFHIAAFKAQIYALGRAYSWANDDAHTALDVAAVWMSIFDNLEECSDVSIMFQQPIPCLLQVSYDGGIVWETIYDGTGCVSEGISGALEDGTIAGPAQPPAIGQGEQGHCYRYHIQLDAKNRWHSPIPVQQGDTITVRSATGAWTDGAAGIFSTWYCPDGLVFALGVCGGDASPFGTDPLPTANHMIILGYIDSEAAPYFDAQAGTYTVSSGTPTPHELFLQANDDPLTDNDGTLTVDVEICKGGTGAWCHTFDFVGESQLGWTFGGGTAYGPFGTFGEGEGFISEMNGADEALLTLTYEFAFPVDLTEISVFWDTPYNRNGSLREVRRVLDGVETFTGALNTGAGSSEDTLTFASTSHDKVIIIAGTTRPGGSGSGPFYEHITKIIFKGDTINPFGSSDCV